MRLTFVIEILSTYSKKITVNDGALLRHIFPIRTSVTFQKAGNIKKHKKWQISKHKEKPEILHLLENSSCIRLRMFCQTSPALKIKIKLIITSKLKETGKLSKINGLTAFTL